jgi:hypothetical protein
MAIYSRRVLYHSKSASLLLLAAPRRTNISTGQARDIVCVDEL